MSFKITKCLIILNIFAIRIPKKVQHAYLLGTVIAAIKHCATSKNISRNNVILNKKIS
jgi:hypothetical protein